MGGGLLDGGGSLFAGDHALFAVTSIGTIFLDTQLCIMRFTPTVKRIFSARKLAEREAVEAREYAVGLMEAAHEPLLVLDEGLRVVSANRAFHRAFQTLPQETEGWVILQLDGGQWDIPALRSLLERVASDGSELTDVRVEHDFTRIGRRTVLFNARRVDRDAGAGLIILAGEEADGGRL